MRYGIVLAPGPEVHEVAKAAEQLGFSSLFAYDTPPAIGGDAFVCLTRCAVATSRISLGTGVTSPRLRSVGAAACAFASLNAIAPGRLAMGIGTGNTARRTFGMPPVSADELDLFVEAFQQLVSGGEATYAESERRAPVRFLQQDGSINLKDPIQVLVAAAGPRALGVAGRRGDGLMAFSAVQAPMAQQLRSAFDAAGRAAGRDTSAAPFYTLSAVHVASDHAGRYDVEARDAVGHVVLSMLRFAIQNPAFSQMLPEPGRAAAGRLAEQYGWPGDDRSRSHQRLYQNYLGRIRLAERELVIPELVDALVVSGDAAACRDRLQSLEAAGVTDFVFQPVVDPIAEIRRFHDTVMR
jgi:alkanesulfonate monooxygenase SsuD/methylene tetrahydromethanopterin reductase-like flavin-dependent oxidoreductase (luciferase family)